VSTLPLTVRLRVDADNIIGTSRIHIKSPIQAAQALEWGASTSAIAQAVSTVTADGQASKERDRRSRADGFDDRGRIRREDDIWIHYL